MVRMTSTHQPLFQASENLFLDLAALNFVRFEGDDDNATAHLNFKDGVSETVYGEAARNFQQRLTGLANADENSPSLAEHSDATPQQSESMAVHIDLSTAPLLGRNKAW